MDWKNHEKLRMVLIALFFVLGLGVAAFIIKSVVIGLIESGAL